MKTKLTLKELREGTKRIMSLKHCVGALLLTKTLKEQGRDMTTGDAIWLRTTGYYRAKTEDNSCIDIDYKSYVNGKETDLMKYGEYYFLTYLKLLIKPIEVEFREY